MSDPAVGRFRTRARATRSASVINAKVRERVVKGWGKRVENPSRIAGERFARVHNACLGGHGEESAMKW